MSLLTQVSNLAVNISKEILLPNFAKVTASFKSDGSLLTEADIKAHEALLLGLPAIKNYPVLSEEMSEAEQQSIIDNESASFWCIDPLDGTSNFTAGIPYWCMSIALIEKGKLTLGIVYDPNRDECFAATNESNSTLNTVEIAPTNSQFNTIDKCMGLIDFKRIESNLAAALASKQPYRSQRSFGASALDFCWIAASRCQLYLHGKQKLWDYSAGLLILQQAGGKAETFEEKNIFQNDLAPKSVIAASNLELMQQWKACIQSASTN